MSYPIEAIGEAGQGHRRTRAPDKMLEVRLMWEKAALVEEVAFRQYCCVIGRWKLRWVEKWARENKGKIFFLFFLVIPNQEIIRFTKYYFSVNKGLIKDS